MGYFFGAATIVGIVSEGEGKKTLAEAIDGRSLEECVGGCYYMFVYLCGSGRYGTDLIVNPIIPDVVVM